METVMKIRRQILVDGKSIRSVSRDTGLSRNTIRKYLQDDSPPTYQRQQTVKQPQLEGYQTRLEQWYSYSKIICHNMVYDLPITIS